MQQWSFETSTSLTATQCRRKPQNPGCSCMLNLSLLWLSAFCSVSCWPGRAGPGVSLLVAALASRLVRIRVRATSVVSFERWAVGGWSHRGVGAHVSMAKARAIWQGGLGHWLRLEAEQAKRHHSAATRLGAQARCKLEHRRPHRFALSLFSFDALLVPPCSRASGPVGLMDKASASGAGDSRFESWAGHCLIFDWPLRSSNEPPVGFEPTTSRLLSGCSAN